MSSKKKIILVILFLLFIVSVILYYTNNLTNIDDLFYSKVILLKNDNITQIFKFFTMLGGVVGTVLLIILILCINRKKGLYFLINIAVILVLNFILKNIFMRDRPIDINIITETGYSFPSGHTMTSVASYGLILYYLFNSSINKILKKFLIFISIFMMCIIPISRVYLGVHFFSDIFAGTCISSIWLIFYTHYLKMKGI